MKVSSLLDATVVQGLRLGIGIGLVAVLALLSWAASRRMAAVTPGEGTFVQHIEELRRRILVMFVAVTTGVMTVFSLRMGPDPWWLPRPALHDTIAAQVFTILRQRALPDAGPDCMSTGEVCLVASRPMEALGAELSLSVVLGLLLAMPVVAGQLAAFIGPALRPAERRALQRAVLPVSVLFAGGAVFGAWWIAPALLEALYDYAAPLGAQPLLGVSDLIGFMAGLAVLFGVAFQTPLAMVVLSRAGLVAPVTWRRKWRHAVVGIVVLCAFATDGTVVTLALVSLPIIGLYLLGMLGAHAQARKGAV